MNFGEPEGEKPVDNSLDALLGADQNDAHGFSIALGKLGERGSWGDGAIVDEFFSHRR